MAEKKLFWGLRVAQSVVFCVVFCRSLFVFSSVFFSPLYFLFFNPYFFCGVRFAQSLVFEKTNNDPQNTTQKTKDSATRTPQKK
jgi:hypothetical protein